MMLDRTIDAVRGTRETPALGGIATRASSGARDATGTLLNDAARVEMAFATLDMR
jgi:hypothetical protein